MLFTCRKKNRAHSVRSRTHALPFSMPTSIVSPSRGSARLTACPARRARLPSACSRGRFSSSPCDRLMLRQPSTYHPTPRGEGCSSTAIGRATAIAARRSGTTPPVAVPARDDRRCSAGGAVSLPRNRSGSRRRGNASGPGVTPGPRRFRLSSRGRSPTLNPSVGMGDCGQRRRWGQPHRRRRFRPRHGPRTSSNTSSVARPVIWRSLVCSWIQSPATNRHHVTNGPRVRSYDQPPVRPDSPEPTSACRTRQRRRSGFRNRFGSAKQLQVSTGLLFACCEWTRFWMALGQVGCSRTLAAQARVAISDERRRTFRPS